MAQEKPQKEKLEKSTVAKFQEAFNEARAMPPGPERDARMAKLKKIYTVMDTNFDPPMDANGPLDKLVDWGLRAADFLPGLARTGTIGLPLYKSGDFTRAIQGQAPTGGEYLERAGVPEGPSTKIGRFNPGLRDVAGLGIDMFVSPGGPAAMRQILKSLKKVPTPNLAKQTAAEARTAKILAENAPRPPLLSTETAKKAGTALVNPWGAQALDTAGEFAYQRAFGPENLAAKESFVMPLGQQAAEKGYPIMTERGKMQFAKDVMKEHAGRRNALRSQLANLAPEEIIPPMEMIQPTGASLDIGPTKAKKPLTEGGLGLRDVKIGLKGERALPFTGQSAEDVLDFLKPNFDLQSGRITKRPSTGLVGSGGPWEAVKRKGEWWAVDKSKKAAFNKWVDAGNKPKKFPGAMKWGDYESARLTGYDIAEVSKIADAAQEVAKLKGAYSSQPIRTKGSPAKNVKNQLTGERLGEAAKDIGYNARRYEEELADIISKQTAGPGVPPKAYGGEIFERNQRIGGAAAAAPIIEKKLDRITPRIAAVEAGIPVSTGAAMYALSQSPLLTGMGVLGGLGLTTTLGKTLTGRALKAGRTPSLFVRPLLLEAYNDKRKGEEQSPWKLMKMELNKYAPSK
jgi:hypothetical protein